MILILYLIIIIYLLLFRRKEKRAWIIAAGAIAILSITTKDYADLQNYDPLFEYINSNNFNISLSVSNVLWALLCKMFYGLGFNYRGMVIGLIFIDYYILHRTALNMKCNENRFFGLFLIFPAIIQLVQLKFFTAYVIVAFAYSILMMPKKRSIPIFILLIVIASLIHSSATLFIILILAKKEKINKKNIFIISVIIMIAIIINMNFISNVSKFIISDKQYERYVNNTITPSSFVWMLMIFLSWLICYLFAITIGKKIKSNVENDYKSAIIQKGIIAINILITTLPLLLLDRNMHRFLEIGFAILYFMVSSLYKEEKVNKRNISLLLILSICIAIVMIIYTPYESVLKPLFSYEGIIKLRR